MDQLLNGLPGVQCYLDNIIITGNNHREHLTNLDRVLERLRGKGLCLKKSKCHCKQSSVEYLGHVLNANGVHTTPSKQRAIAEARAPSNVAELRSFLGLVNYYGLFLPNVSTVLHPLNCLLRKGAGWLWTRKCQEVPGSISSHQGDVEFGPGTGSLWPYAALESCGRCLCIWCWGSDLSEVSG